MGKKCETNGIGNDMKKMEWGERMNKKGMGKNYQRTECGKKSIKLYGEKNIKNVWGKTSMKCIG